MLSCMLHAWQEDMRNGATCDSKRLMRCPEVLLVTMLCLNLYVHLQQGSGSQVQASASSALFNGHQASCTTAVQLHMPRRAHSWPGASSLNVSPVSVVRF